MLTLNCRHKADIILIHTEYLNAKVCFLLCWAAHLTPSYIIRHLDLFVIFWNFVILILNLNQFLWVFLCVWLHDNSHGLRGWVTTSLLKQQHVLNVHSVGFRFLEFPFSKLLHFGHYSAFNRLLNSEWFQAGTLSSLNNLYFYSDWWAAVCQRSAVLLWPQLWSPTPPIWESWTWVTTTWRIQEWSCCVIFYRVQTADWRLWGQFTDSVTVVLIFEFTSIYYLSIEL